MKPATRTTVYVVIPSYNTADLLCRCLDSLQAQRTQAALEIYVVDNASSDESVERVRADYAQVHLLVSEHNGGFAYAVNMALRCIPETKSDDYVLLLNSDTELPPDTIERMLAFMYTHPQAGAAGPRLIMGDGHTDKAGRRSFPTPKVAFYQMIGLSSLFPHSRRFGRYNLSYLDPEQTAEVDSVCGAFMLVRGEVVEQVGLLDETFFLYGEDLDWAYRIRARGWKIYYHPAVRVRHWKRASSRKQPRTNLRHFYQAMRIFYRKHLAPHYAKPVNWLVELGISLREALALAANLFRKKDTLR